ncbi:MAG: hypothetical protein K5871_03145 [Lachnospiraceae bacterium]|nr:hypothetical protein [Lachnospiraceae bacterium]
MSIFEPVWKTKKTAGKDKAIAYVGSLKDEAKLNRIILSAPLTEVRSAAVDRLLSLKGKNYRPDEKFCLETLLNIEPLTLPAGVTNNYYWYEKCLMAGMGREDKYLLATQARSQQVRLCAVKSIFIEDDLVKLITESDASDILKDVALKRITQEGLLKKIAENEGVDPKIRDMALKEHDRLCCMRHGHKAEFVEFVLRENGGRDKLYICQRCGERILQPYD